ncbi:unnamed protein product [Trichogramma brassicae]|uniref:Uncharacterized protein n=1 Tax=Trichogramma brassicae TaxID=86971 RepID=A0A6H5J3C3_9HYME|nr:unnamed protein product [Trichogramma brassicae]
MTIAAFCDWCARACVIAETRICPFSYSHKFESFCTQPISVVESIHSGINIHRMHRDRTSARCQEQLLILVCTCAQRRSVYRSYSSRSSRLHIAAVLDDNTHRPKNVCPSATSRRRRERESIKYLRLLFCELDCIITRLYAAQLADRFGANFTEMEKLFSMPESYEKESDGYTKLALALAAAAATAAAAEAEQYPRKDLTPLLAPTASCCMHYVYTRARANRARSTRHKSSYCNGIRRSRGAAAAKIRKSINSISIGRSLHRSRSEKKGINTRTSCLLSSHLTRIVVDARRNEFSRFYNTRTYSALSMTLQRDARARNRQSLLSATAVAAESKKKNTQNTCTTDSTMLSTVVAFPLELRRKRKSLYSKLDSRVIDQSSRARGPA